MECRIYDYSKLEIRMKEYRYSQQTLSREVPMARNSLNLKLNNKGYFTQREIKKICEILKITDTQIGVYFFKEFVHKTVLTDIA